MGRLVFNKDAKELCLDNWALAASALFHNALINIDAKYNVLKKKRERKVEIRDFRQHRNKFNILLPKWNANHIKLQFKLYESQINFHITKINNYHYVLNKLPVQYEHLAQELRPDWEDV